MQKTTRDGKHRTSISLTPEAMTWARENRHWFNLSYECERLIRGLMTREGRH